MFSSLVLDWFDQHGRKDLPWQQSINAYRVWVSEIMLQQTQVKTVIPYFNRFITRFPTVGALANAKEDEVLTYWAGLGYYARARNLHKSAVIIHRDYQDIFPLDSTELQKLPGIGRSTAGAILAIAGNLRAPILDGNVKRVLTRYYGITEPPNEIPVLKKLWEIAEKNTSAKRSAHYTQAIMDLGAMICARKPQCECCPLSKSCKAFQTGQQRFIPAKKAKNNIPVRLTTFMILQEADRVLLEKRPSIGIWGGLWCFPETKLPQKKMKTMLLQQYDCDMISIKSLPPFRHTFSHFHLDINPLIIHVKKRNHLLSEDQRFFWYNRNDPDIAMPAPIKQLVKQIFNIVQPA